MYLGKTLFAQAMDFLPWKTFHRIVNRYGGDYRTRSLSCAEQFRVMAFAQLTYRPVYLKTTGRWKKPLTRGACRIGFIVRDASGQALGHLRKGAKLNNLTYDEGGTNNNQINSCPYIWSLYLAHL